MRVAITSTVLLEVPNGGDPEVLKRAFYEANQYAVGRAWNTTSGVHYHMLAIERFELEVRSPEAWSGVYPVRSE